MERILVNATDSQARLKRLVDVCPACGIVVALRYRGERCVIAACPQRTIQVQTTRGQLREKNVRGELTE